MPPRPSAPRSDNDMSPLISDSSSDSDTYTPRRKTSITDASSYPLRPPPTTPTAPTLSSSQSLLHPLLLRDLHPTPSATAYSPPPGSLLHSPPLCLATANIAHLPPPRHPLSGRHTPTVPPACALLLSPVYPLVATSSSLLDSHLRCPLPPQSVGGPPVTYTRPDKSQ